MGGIERGRLTRAAVRACASNEFKSDDTILVLQYYLVVLYRLYLQ